MQKNAFASFGCNNYVLMNYHQDITTLIGNTPMVRIGKLSEGIDALLLAKVECFNPGHSVKDRIALQMINDAEVAGVLRPGGTIIEATSGNTGSALALLAISRGYRCILTISDKQSREKIDILKALGAEVRVCPSSVSYDHPDSYYSVAKRLSEELPNAFFPFQYDNLSNSAAHYRTTGPEIWEQTSGKVTHFVAGVGTGGTICGISKYLKEKNPLIQIIGVEPEGSIFTTYKRTGIVPRPEEVAPHYTEGIGSDFIPKNVDIDRIDHIVCVSDRDAAWTARHMARREALFVGWSCGAAVCGALRYARTHRLGAQDVVVVLLPDHGSRYVQKIYNDDWMREKGYWSEKESERYTKKEEQQP